jgi:hypothetical protein
LPWIALLLALAVAWACSGTNQTSSIPPVTGVIIRADALLGGIACGRGKDQVFKYAATVKRTTSNPDAGTTAGERVASNVFDCFADGIFIRLTATGNETFHIDIRAWSEAAFAQQQAEQTIDPQNVDVTTLTRATYQTTCTATQQSDIIVLAECNTLAPTGFVPDAGVVEAEAGADAEAGTDAAAEAGNANDAGDAGDAATD